MMPQSVTFGEMFLCPPVVRRVAATVIWASLVAAATSPAGATAIVFTDSGAAPADIADTVGAYGAALGTLNPNVAGSFGSGRREINWDGVPDAFSAPNALPPDFFNVNSPRGAVFFTPGTGFQVSARAGIGPTEFDNLEAGSSTNFQTFSPQRLFTAVGSTVTDVLFFVPGSPTPAFVTGFGAVFTGVEATGATFIDYFGLDDQLLASVTAPVGGAGSLSFAGLFFDDGTQIGRVRLHSGQVPLGSSDGDRVVMDDFIYGEPVAAPVPEPATLVLFGAAAVAARRRLKRR